MFSSSVTDNVKIAASQVSDLTKAYEHLLSFRISLQKPLDIISKFPVCLELEPDSSVLNQLESMTKDLVSLLVSGKDINTKKSKKLTNSDKKDLFWNEIINPQILLEEKWSSVLNKLHARINFGSDQNMKKLKVFNNSFWDQVMYNKYILMNICID